MKFSRTAKNKWLAACLFSVTVLAGFQLQHVDAHAEQPQQQTQNTGNSAPTNGSVSGVVTGSFGNQPGHTVTLQSASSTATSTATQTDTNQPAPSPQVPTAPQTPSPETPTVPNNGTATPNSGPTSPTQGNTTNQPAQTSEPAGTTGTPTSNQGSTTSNTNDSQLGQLKVNAIDGVTNTNIAGDTYTGEYQGTTGSPIKDKSALVTPIPGYSYVGNVDKEIPDNFVKDPQTANLTYMPLSPIVVHYVDTADPSNVLWTYSLPTNMATKGQVYDTDDSQLQFTGYIFDHDSGNTTGNIDQTVKSLTDSNPIVVNYYYRPESGQAGTVNTTNWIVTSETNPIGLTGEYSFSLYLKRDQSAPIKVGSYDIGQAGSGHTTVTGSGSTLTTGTTNTSGSNNSGTSTTTSTTTLITTETTDTTVGTTGNTVTTTVTGNASSLTTPILTPLSPVSAPTATVNIVTETGKPLSQLTVSGKLGANVRTQIQQRLNGLRQNGYVILSNDVKGNTTLNQTNPVMTIKVSHPDRQANPFKHNTMPIVAQLGNASQSVNAAAKSANVTAQSMKSLFQTAAQASSTTNTVTDHQNATNQTSIDQLSNGQSSNDQATQSSTNQNSDSSNSNSGQTDQNMNQQNQKITQNTATSQATSKDAEGNSQVHRDAVANNGQSFGHAAANNGSGGHSVSGLAAYFISLSGKINLGSRG
ncbi:hypothetical protein ACFP1H_08405 [Secundilactobacillus hailunensis]|uniref:Uncharacterized protein n=1 Tax=Secundilactobacillus hailunensis TaxID=2559923 RepID=A0ABW1TAE3_9LACO|nr:hypothetical protein [Secundilactobacillus hailunensis]